MVQPLCLLIMLRAAVAACLPFVSSRGRCLSLAVAFYGTYTVALIVPWLWPAVRIGHWNWAGKLLAILVSVASMRAAGLSREEVGLRLPRGARAWLAALLGIVVLGGSAIAERLAAGTAPYDGETLAFQASMPSLDEELAYRGLLFALLCRGFPTPRGRTVAATLVVLLFWMAHVVGLRDGRVWLAGPRPEVLLSSVLFMTFRLLTGSIVVTAIAHSLDNIANTVA